MKCPVCSSKSLKVIETRSSVDGYAIRRRRECMDCTFRFSTYEEPEILDVVVVKKNGNRELYSKEKLTRGLIKSLEKRPYTEEGLKKLVTKIEIDIQSLRKTELTSEELGKVVMQHLKDFDEVAYIRFASVYQSFKDVKTLQEEIAKLLK